MNGILVHDKGSACLLLEINLKIRHGQQKDSDIMPGIKQNAEE